MYIKNSYRYVGILFLCGALLNISFFVHTIYAQLLALFIIAPVFVILTKSKPTQRYIGSVVFFASWLLPTTYWYFLFMPIWLALFASISYVLLISLVFIIPHWFSIRHIIGQFSLIIIIWIIFIATRTLLPYVELLWIPHIAYTQWLNPLIVQFAAIGSIYSIMFVILLINATTAYCIIKKNWYIVSGFIFTIIIVCLGGNALLQHKIADEHDIIIIAVQAMPRAGIDADATHEDVLDLQDMTLDALSKIETIDIPIITVWPENYIKPPEQKYIQDFAKNNNIYIVHNRLTYTDDDPYNTAVLVDNRGNISFENHKKYPAPGEEIMGSNIFDTAQIDTMNITADICYDLHFLDIKERLKNQHLLLAPVDDSVYGSFMPYLHAADIVFRAVENSVNIATASTNGPTMFVNKFGVVENKPLPMYTTDVAIYEKKI